MKVAYVDIDLTGHHKQYLCAFLNYFSESIAIIPEEIKEMPRRRQFVIKNTTELHKYPLRYFSWLREVYQIIEREKVDQVHFLYGDAFARYFGLGLKKFKKYHPIITFHQIRSNKIKDVSLVRIIQKINKGIVHTNKLYEDFKRLGLKNVVHIEYPFFIDYSQDKFKKTRGELEISNDKVVLLMIGVLSRYKGLDLLVDALSKLNDDNYFLVVAGKNVGYSDSEISEYEEKLEGKVSFVLKNLNELEYGNLLYTSDYVVLPYRKVFDGASGPLVDSVSLRHPVIASNHGSLGQIVEDNSLGYLFECENVESLTDVLKSAINNIYRWNDRAEQYRESIKLRSFLSKNSKLYV